MFKINSLRIAVFLCSLLITAFPMVCQDPVLTKSTLKESRWGCRRDFAYFLMSFSDTTCTITTKPIVGDFESKVEGQYSINSNTLTITNLKQTKAPEGVNRTFEPSEQLQFDFIAISGNYYYRFVLKQKNNVNGSQHYQDLDFFLTNLEINPGDTVITNNIETVAIKKTAQTTANLKARMGPSLNHKNLTFDFDIYFQFRKKQLKEKLPYIPHGYYITVLGRTKNKVQVQKWNNYWYYVEITESIDTMSVARQQRGWVFGEFITFPN